MATQKDYTVTESKQDGGSLPSYVFGFVSSIGLTLVAYFLAVHRVFIGSSLILILMELAILQFVAQLFLFLHFGKEKSPRWRLLTVVLMLVFVLILVLGSIWIMASLNYNMSPERIQQYMKNQISEGF